jgi:hypothetical protein
VLDKHAERLFLSLGILAFLSSQTFIKYLLQYFSLWAHELGHAVMSWLSGIKATPINFGYFGMTFHSEPERSFFVFISFLFLMVFLITKSKVHNTPFVGWVASIFMISSCFFTWINPNFKNHELIIFSGFAGELVLSALLIVSFFYKLPSRFQWDNYFKWPFLYLGFFILMSSTGNWISAYQQQSLTPFGSNFSEETVAGVPGDLFRLMEDYHWPI